MVSPVLKSVELVLGKVTLNYFITLPSFHLHTVRGKGEISRAAAGLWSSDNMTRHHRDLEGSTEVHGFSEDDVVHLTFVGWGERKRFNMLFMVGGRGKHATNTHALTHLYAKSTVWWKLHGSSLNMGNQAHLTGVYLVGKLRWTS